jgi:hypothetical protein
MANSYLGMREPKFIMKMSHNISYRILAAAFIAVLIISNCTLQNDPELTYRAFKVEEELKIGSLDGQDEYIFGDINDVVPGNNGTIIVSDIGANLVRVFNHEGKFIKNVGRSGKGPGEYTGISGLKTFHDGQIAILNTGLMRINIYNPSGEIDKTIRIENDLFSTNMFEVDFENNMYVKTVLKSGPEYPNWVYGWIKINARGEIVDTIEVPEEREQRPLSFVLYTASGPAYPFIFEPHFDMNSNGMLVYGHNRNNRIKMISQDSDTLIFELPAEKAPILEEEKRQWEAWKDYYNTKTIIPQMKPYFKRIVSDSDGRIWVQRYSKSEKREFDIGPHYGPEIYWWEQPTFDVFTPDGSYWETVQLPLRANFSDAKGDDIYAIYKGEFDEEYAVRYRIIKKH